MRGKGEQRRAHVSTCEGKEQFTSYSLAAEIAKKRSRHGKKNHVYRCGTCHAFHLGSPMGPGRLWSWRREPFADDDEVLA